MTAESVNRQPAPNQLARYVVLAIVLLAAIGVVVWLVAFHHTKHHPKKQKIYQTIGPTGFTAKNLRAESKFINTRFFWAGPQPGTTYEFTRNTKGWLYVRYLPHGVKVGVKGGHFLIVATYPRYGYTALKKQAKNNAIAGPGGSIIYVRPHNHKNVLMAFPNINDEVEIYSPSAKVSLDIAKSSNIVPVR